MRGWLRPFLTVLAPWAAVLLGRQLCLAAQRVPALVVLVRAVRRWLERR